MSLAYRENDRIFLHPASLAKIPFIGGALKPRLAGADFFFGYDCKVFVLISQIPDCKHASIVHFIEIIIDNLRHSLLGELPISDIRFFCYHPALSISNIIYKQILEFVPSETGTYQSIKTPKETIEFILDHETWIDVVSPKVKRILSCQHLEEMDSV